MMLIDHIKGKSIFLKNQQLERENRKMHCAVCTFKTTTLHCSSCINKVFNKQESKAECESSQCKLKLQDILESKDENHNQTQIYLTRARINQLECKLAEKHNQCEELKNQIQLLRQELKTRNAQLVHHGNEMMVVSRRIKEESSNAIKEYQEILEKDLKRLVHAQSWLFREFNTIFELKRIPVKVKEWNCFTSQAAQYKIRHLNPLHTFEFPSVSQLEEYNTTIEYICHMMCLLSHYVDRMLPYSIEWKENGFVIDGHLPVKLILENHEPFCQAIAMLNYNLVELCLGKGIQVDFESSVDTLGLVFKILESQTPYSSSTLTAHSLDIDKLIQLQRYLFQTPSNQRSREEFNNFMQQEMELLTKEGEWQMI